ncbi:NAD-dependent succinate-semialdehyde dehydrogenase [Pseudoxanthomonas indica]|uniref:Succinate-semialdehyde dehydrogenase / glutarate-semialdehyde dehydrogenase n=1 Tax=Pseudoxanthomonas indica TaxID=428993 RepID=A0A1T5LRN1_9GAMM|nr:NAD-dependent succinate-semialdehyde dehydrogenase [Pseudoxanthomonas indica]GGD38778.1 succinate-semialdehyde dehydrogenase [Pseudoxanthomonas indica]SKC78666.1 succinate-semialdehyde dehydrogenase / glutarate-semialdehyde dehydrogenase [Pseudoxanthomonas indica]
MNVDTVNPATGQVEHSQKLMDSAEIEAILAATQPAFKAWAARPLEERGHLLRNVGAELRRRRDDIQRTMTAEMGKLKKEALAEVDKCAGACDYYADHAADYLKDQPISTDGSRSYVRFEPIGCVLAVMPWNFPIWQVFRFLAPALMAGNVAVLKHASNVPRCADIIADVLHEAGIPAGVFAALHIDNDQAAAVIRDPRIAAVTLTGSERAGRSVAGNAGQQLKKCVMELGGSDAFVVLEDADLDKTVAGAIASRFGNAGQTCIAAKRFIVVDAIADKFVERFKQAAAKLALGDPEAESTTLAPLARQDLRDELHKQVQASIALGASALLGCAPDASHAGYPASILDNVAPGMPAYEEELFGPVASILRVKDEAEAVQVANDTNFGLGGSVWTGDSERGNRVARQLQVGAAFVNAIVRSDVRLPFGGTKRSGFGRELAEHGIHEFMNIKSVYVA